MIKNKFALFGILALALAVQIGYLLSSRTSPFFDPLLLDPRYYHDWAMRLVRQEWDRGVFYGLPLYPYFLAAVYSVTHASASAVKIVQILLGVSTVFFIYRTAEKIDGPRAAVLAGVLACVYGPLFFHQQVFIPEALAVPLYAAAFYAACLLWDKLDAKRALFFGISAGLAALAKAGILLFAPVILSALFWKHLKSRGRVHLVTTLLSLLFILAPVPLHNYLRAQERVWLTSHAGFNFYIGNNPTAEGVFKAPEGSGTNVDAQIEDSKMLAERAVGRSLKASEVSRYWSDKAWAFIQGDPGRFLWLCGRKLLLFFDAREISDVDDYQFGAQVTDFLKLPWANFLWLGPLVFAGLYSVARRSPYAGPVYLWVGAYVLGIISFFVNARYRLPMLPIFISLGAVAAVDVLDSFKQLRVGRAFLLCALAGLGFWVGNLGLVGTDFTRDYVNAGDALVEKKDFEGAERFYRQALSVNPEHSKAHLAMGLLKTRQGLYDQAKDYYEKAIRGNAQNSQAYNNLGLWYDRAGELDKAQECFLKALQLKPNSSQAHNNLGMVYGKRGENAKAAREFEKSLALNPKSPRALTNLGLIYYRMRRFEEAVKLWRQALEIDPEFSEARKALSIRPS